MYKCSVTNGKEPKWEKITNKEYIKKSPLGPWGSFPFIISQKISAKACIIISQLHASVYKYLVKPACQKYHRRESEMFKCLWKGRYQIKEKTFVKKKQLWTPGDDAPWLVYNTSSCGKLSCDSFTTVFTTLSLETWVFSTDDTARDEEDNRWLSSEALFLSLAQNLCQSSRHSKRIVPFTAAFNCLSF